MKKALCALLAVIALTGCAEKPKKLIPRVTNHACHEGASVQGEPCDNEQDCALQNNGNVIHFRLNSAVLDFTAQKTLLKQSEWLKQNPQMKLLIEGHADERGTREYNIALGGRRAEAARDYLIALGVDASRLATTSYGKERPALIGEGEEIWSQNRRAVLTLRDDEAGQTSYSPQESQQQDAPVQDVTENAPSKAE